MYTTLSIILSINSGNRGILAVDNRLRPAVTKVKANNKKAIASPPRINSHYHSPKGDPDGYGINKLDILSSVSGNETPLMKEEESGSEAIR